MKIMSKEDAAKKVSEDGCCSGDDCEGCCSGDDCCEEMCCQEENKYILNFCLKLKCLFLIKNEKRFF